MKKSVVILQGQIPPYRVPFFNALGQVFNVTVIHGGKPVAVAGQRFKEVVLPLRKAGPFHILSGLDEHFADRPSAVVGMFDLRWPQFIARRIEANESRFLLWGHRYSRHAAVNMVRDILLKRSDGAILYGEEERQRMLARGIPREKIFISPNSIEIPNYADTSRQSKSSLLYVGRLQERKRLDTIMNAFAAVQAEIPAQVTFDIVGEGEVRKSLESLARSLLPAHRVIFHGAQSDHAVLKPLFSKAVAYVSDNVGLGLLHSFAYGVPVVTFRHTAQTRTGFRHGPEMHDFQDGVNGVLCGDEGAFREVIVRLFSQPSWSSSLGLSAYLLYKEGRTMDHMVNGFADAVLGRPLRVLGQPAKD
jgi:glycosyltransferase involved in cell wall biosynthesis